MTHRDYLAAEELAADLLARRATQGHPMRGALHNAYGRAALAHGFGWAGGWDGPGHRVTRKPIPTVEGVAAWLVWCAEFLDHAEAA